MPARRPTHIRVKTATAGSAAAVLLSYFFGLPDAVSLAVVALGTYAAGWLPDAD